MKHRKDYKKDDKILLVQDLCSRLPHGVYIKHMPTGIIGKLNNINIVHIYKDTNSVQDVEASIAFLGDDHIDVTCFKPFLYPRSKIADLISAKEFTQLSDMDLIEWYNANHIDYHTDDKGKTMLEKGLAIEAPDGMYN